MSTDDAIGTDKMPPNAPTQIPRPGLPDRRHRGVLGGDHGRLTAWSSLNHATLVTPSSRKSILSIFGMFGAGSPPNSALLAVISRRPSVSCPTTMAVTSFHVAVSF